MNMKKTARHIKKLIQTGEGYHLEFKKSLDKSFAAEICAFANATGGKILIGVADDKTITGTIADNITRSRIQDVINQIEPKIDAKISIADNIIVVDVPEGMEKPYGCSRGFFLRIGPNSQKLTRNQIVSFFRKEGRIRFDEMENSKADFTKDFDASAFNNFLRLASITPSIDQKFLLTNLDCLSENKQMTNAGVLFFSKSIEFIMLQATVTCVLYKGCEKVHILDRKDFSGNIMENIENAVMFVMRHTNLEYRIETLRREEISEIPEVALREAVVNAVCHRDYFEKGANVMIEIFEDRLEISNPGGLPSGLTAKSFGTRSVARNPVIAALLHRAGYIEKIGTGIKRIEKTVAEHKKGSVSFSFNTFFRVSFSRVQENRKALGEKLGEKLGENRLKIVSLMKNNSKITIPELAENIGISTTAIEKNIMYLKKQKIIRRIGPAKGGYWEVVDLEE